ncbi:Na/Pi-cotransporter [Helicobacter monodelphidis]|uniref:Na/Pi cotransporter family protein n=1 Tax=Helicobacter sp. 15-1451 TaxID=2004995 RepID=UPI000DCE890C|nr:Na/Pi symporter [Helicobacter sp. 15-1451]RAX58247.1 Na/Pi-cotransporter [Helicobacter sp. 15-1451]
MRQVGLAVGIVLLLYFFSTNAELSQILAGVAILLFGISSLGNGFKSFSDGLLEKVLKKSTSTTPKSITFGTIATVIMQSSTLVSVISISFLSAGLITLARGLGVVFGANLGNSAGSWIIVGLSNIKISDLALPLVVVGALLSLQKAKLYKGLGGVFIGLGFFFLGVAYIKDGFSASGDMINFAQFSADGYLGAFIFCGVGALLTGIVQSSHATLAMILLALSAGQLTYENALAATLGTSVGGVVTAVVASLSANIEGKKLAIGNCVFNFTIAIIVLALFPLFVQLVNFGSSTFGIAEDNYALKVAFFHTLFNLIAVLIISPFIPQIVAFLDKTVKAPKDKDISAPEFLKYEIIEYPDEALNAIENEIKHLYDNAFAIIVHTLGFSREDIRSQEELSELVKKPWYKGDVDIDYLYQKKIKALFDAIMDFSSEAQAYIDDQSRIERVYSLKVAARSLLEAVKILKLAQKNLKTYSTSPNPALSGLYNTLRMELAELLRSGEDLKKMTPENIALIVSQLNEAKKFFEVRDKEALSKVEALISEKKITVSQGTSVLNDSSFIDNISKEIIEAIRIIYAHFVQRATADDQDDGSFEREYDS